MIITRSVNPGYFSFAFLCRFWPVLWKKCSWEELVFGRYVILRYDVSIYKIKIRGYIFTKYLGSPATGCIFYHQLLTTCEHIGRWCSRKSLTFQNFEKRSDFSNKRACKQNDWCHPVFLEFLDGTYLIKNQQWKHQKNVWNLFNVKNKDTATTGLMRSGVFNVNFEQLSLIALVFPLFSLRPQ